MTRTKSNEEYRKLGEKIADLKEKKGMPYVTIGPKMGFSDSYASKIYKKFKAGEYDEVKIGEDVKDDLNSITQEVAEEFDRQDALEKIKSPDNFPICKDWDTDTGEPFHSAMPKLEKVTCIVSHVDRKSGEWLPSIHVDIEIPTGLEGDKRTAVMHNEVVKYLMCEEL